MSKWRIISKSGPAALTGVLLAKTIGTAGGIDPNLERQLPVSPGFHETAVIVTLAPLGQGDETVTPNRKAHRTAILRRLKNSFEARLQPVRHRLEASGGRHVVMLWAAHAIAMRADPDLIREIAAWPEVESVRPDRQLRVWTIRKKAPTTMARELRRTVRLRRDLPHLTPLPTGDPVVTPPASRRASTTSVNSDIGDPEPAWNLHAIRAPELWSRGFKGAGVVLASLDTGVDGQHPALAPQYRGGANSWYDPHGEHATPVDTDGHGTQALSLAIGRDADGQAIGVAPEAQWIAAKVFNDAGIAHESDLHRSLQWVLDPDGNPNTDDAPDVVYLPWTVDKANRCNRAFQDELDLLRASGIAVVISAGNAGPDRATSVSPANNAGQFSVGSVSRDLTVSSFSSRGPSACTGGEFPEVLAPGEQVMAADLSLGGMPNYAVVNGTSFAAPHVAGAMALLMSAFPDKPLTLLESALKATTVPVRTPGDPSLTVHGLIDTMAAYRAVLTGSGIGQ